MLHKLGDKFRQFMYGRYGSDKLNLCLLGLAVALCLLSSFPRFYLLGTVAFIPLIWAVFRMYSRNISKRQQENRRFLQFFARLKDRQHRYFACPRCRQRVRVPRGKGKIVIRCPACGERFTKKT